VVSGLDEEKRRRGSAIYIEGAAIVHVESFPKL
jgi:hypothetical protein